MGSLIPTPNDIHICARLNFRFSTEHLKALRAHKDKGEHLFDENHKRLHRTAHRIRCAPNGSPARKRWFKLLNPQTPNGMPESTREEIRELLKTAIDDQGVDSVEFDVRHDPNYSALPFALLRINNQIPYYDVPGRGRVYQCTLVSKNDVPIAMTAAEILAQNDPPDADPDEENLVIADPPF